MWWLLAFKKVSACVPIICWWVVAPTWTHIIVTFQVCKYAGEQRSCCGSRSGTPVHAVRLLLSAFRVTVGW